MVAERNFGALQFIGHAVQNASAQAGAQGAKRFAFWDFVHHDRIGILLFDMKLHAFLLQVGWQDVFRKTGLLLIEIDRKQLKINRRARLQFEQNIQHRVAVFSAREANHHAVALFNHVVVNNRLAGLAAQALVELVVFQSGARDFFTAHRSHIGHLRSCNFSGSNHVYIVSFSAYSFLFSIFTGLLSKLRLILSSACKDDRTACCCTRPLWLAISTDCIRANWRQPVATPPDGRCLPSRANFWLGHRSK